MEVAASNRLSGLALPIPPYASNKAFVPNSGFAFIQPSAKAPLVVLLPVKYHTIIIQNNQVNYRYAKKQ